MASEVTEKSKQKCQEIFHGNEVHKEIKSKKIKKARRNCNRHFVGNASLQFNCCDLMSLMSLMSFIRSFLSLFSSRTQKLCGSIEIYCTSEDTPIFQIFNQGKNCFDCSINTCHSGPYLLCVRIVLVRWQRTIKRSQ